MRIVHLSDPHVLCDYQGVPLSHTGWRGVIPRFELTAMRRKARYAGVQDRLRNLVAQVNALDADHVVVTGDLSAIGTKEELTLARELFAPLANRLSVIPGNHDRYGFDDEQHQRFEREFDGCLQSDLPRYATSQGYPFVRLIGDRLALVGVDSTRVAPAAQYFMGRVGDEQLSALDRLLDDPHLEGRLVLLLVHHAPLSARGQRDRASAGMWDSEKFLKVVRRRVNAIHHGHVHERYRHDATLDRPALFGAGSATELGGEGFFVVEYGEGQVRTARSVAPLDAA